MTMIRALALTVSLMGLAFHSVGGYAEQALTEQILKGLRDALPYTKFAEDVYEDQSNINGWKNIGDSSHPSGFYSRTYQKGNEIVVAFRGSEKIKDFAAHALSYFPASDIQGLVAGAFAEKFLPTIPPEGDFNITFVGHSSGGGLAQIATVVANNSFPHIKAEAFTYNTKGVTRHIFGKLEELYGRRAVNEADITNICIKGEVICGDLFGKSNHGKTIKIPSVLANPVEIVIKNHELATVIDQMKAVINSPEEYSFYSSGDEIIVEEYDYDRFVDTDSMGRENALYTQDSTSVIGTPTPPYRGGGNEEQRQYQEDQQRLGSNVREDVNTDGIILEAPADIILSWGEQPRDLDSHLTGPQGDGERFHIYFGNPGSLNSAPNALLHTDYTDHRPGGSNLPEQTRINQLEEGEYRFYVHDYTNRGSRNSDALSKSGASVTVYHGGEFSNREGVGVGENKFADTIDVPDREGNTWHAFDIDSRSSILTPKDELRDIDSPQEVPFND